MSNLTPSQKDLLLKKYEDERLKAKLESELPHLFKYKPYKWMKEFWESDSRIRVLVAANQVGKAVCPNKEIPTPIGFRLMGDLCVGDEVIGSDGRPTKITAIPFEGHDEFFRITFDDGDCIEASGNHDWICRGPDERFRKKSFNYLKWQVRSTKEIYDHCYSNGNPKAARRYVIPMCDSVEYSEKVLPCNPYLFGLMLGDGCLSGRQVSLSINECDREIVEWLDDFSINHYPESGVFRVLLGKQGWLDKYSLRVCSDEKYIPKLFLLGSISQRKALLSGLMDTDGYADARGQSISYTTVSEKLAANVKELVNSLGGFAEIKKSAAGYKRGDEFVRCKDAYTVNIWTEFNPFGLCDRKKRRWVSPKRYRHQRVIYSIERIGIKRGKCITVDNEDGSFLCGKEYIVTHNSTTNVIDCITKATDQSMWPKWFPVRKPISFWYIYPNLSKVHEQYSDQWLKDLLPRGSMKDSPIYGWRRIGDKHNPAIEFNSGVTVRFRTWASDLQASTLDAIYIDEECPEKLWGELAARVTATGPGLMTIVFTATIGQKFFHDIIEARGTENEILPNAAKWQISMEHDCRYFIDGTASHFNKEYVEERKASCATEKEVQKRIHGRFVTDSGLVYENFDRNRIVKRLEKEPPSSWLCYAGIDVGSGGHAHPAAISVVAVNPTYTRGRLIRFWRGDNQETTSDDILNKYLQMTKGLNMAQTFYDWQSRDFFITAQRAGVPMEPAEKAKDFGQDLLRQIFKHAAVTFDDFEDVYKLCEEIELLREGTKKSNAKDDGIDSFRFAVAKVPWNFSEYVKRLRNEDEKTPAEVFKEEQEKQILKRNMYRPPGFTEDQGLWGVENDIDEYIDLLEG